MSSFTIHMIDNELDLRLSAEAKKRGTSKNNLVKDLLAEALGIARHTAKYDDYQSFSGVWTAAERAEFEAAIADVRTINHEDWV